MEDAATAEISRTQLWQWIRHGAPIDGGGQMSREYYLDVLVLEEFDDFLTVRAAGLLT